MGNFTTFGLFVGANHYFKSWPGINMWCRSFHPINICILMSLLGNIFPDECGGTFSGVFPKNMLSSWFGWFGCLKTEFWGQGRLACYFVLLQILECLDLLLSLLESHGRKYDQLYILLFEPEQAEMLYKLLTYKNYPIIFYEKVVKVSTVHLCLLQELPHHLLWEGCQGQHGSFVFITRTTPSSSMRRLSRSARFICVYYKNYPIVFYEKVVKVSKVHLCLLQELPHHLLWEGCQGQQGSFVFITRTTPSSSMRRLSRSARFICVLLQELPHHLLWEGCQGQQGSFVFITRTTPSSSMRRLSRSAGFICVYYKNYPIIFYEKVVKVSRVHLCLLQELPHHLLWEGCQGQHGSFVFITRTTPSSSMRRLSRSAWFICVYYKNYPIIFYEKVVKVSMVHLCLLQELPHHLLWEGCQGQHGSFVFITRTTPSSSMRRLSRSARFICVYYKNYPIIFYEKVVKVSTVHLCLLQELPHHLLWEGCQGQHGSFVTRTTPSSSMRRLSRSAGFICVYYKNYPIIFYEKVVKVSMVHLLQELPHHLLWEGCQGQHGSFVTRTTPSSSMRRLSRSARFICYKNYPIIFYEKVVKVSTVHLCLLQELPHHLLWEGCQGQHGSFVTRTTPSSSMRRLSRSARFICVYYENYPIIFYEKVVKVSTVHLCLLQELPHHLLWEGCQGQHGSFVFITRTTPSSSMRRLSRSARFICVYYKNYPIIFYEKVVKVSTVHLLQELSHHLLWEGCQGQHGSFVFITRTTPSSSMRRLSRSARFICYKNYPIIFYEKVVKVSMVHLCLLQELPHHLLWEGCQGQHGSFVTRTTPSSSMRRLSRSAWFICVYYKNYPIIFYEKVVKVSTVHLCLLQELPHHLLWEGCQGQHGSFVTRTTPSSSMRRLSRSAWFICVTRTTPSSSMRRLSRSARFICYKNYPIIFYEKVVKVSTVHLCLLQELPHHLLWEGCQGQHGSFVTRTTPSSSMRRLSRSARFICVYYENYPIIFYEKVVKVSTVHLCLLQELPHHLLWEGCQGQHGSFVFITRTTPSSSMRRLSRSARFICVYYKNYPIIFYEKVVKVSTVHLLQELSHHLLWEGCQGQHGSFVFITRTTPSSSMRRLSRSARFICYKNYPIIFYEKVVKVSMVHLCLLQELPHHLLWEGCQGQHGSFVTRTTPSSSMRRLSRSAWFICVYYKNYPIIFYEKVVKVSTVHLLQELPHHLLWEGCQGQHGSFVFITRTTPSSSMRRLSRSAQFICVYYKNYPIIFYEKVVKVSTVHLCLLQELPHHLLWEGCQGQHGSFVFITRTTPSSSMRRLSRSARFICYKNYPIIFYEKVVKVSTVHLCLLQELPHHLLWEGCQGQHGSFVFITRTTPSSSMRRLSRSARFICVYYKNYPIIFYEKVVKVSTVHLCLLQELPHHLLWEGCQGQHGSFVTRTTPSSSVRRLSRSAWFICYKNYPIIFYEKVVKVSTVHLCLLQELPHHLLWEGCQGQQGSFVFITRTTPSSSMRRLSRSAWFICVSILSI